MALRALVLFAAAPCVVLAKTEDAVGSWAADEDVCAPSDTECALSLRQLRASALATDGAEEEGESMQQALAEDEESDASSGRLSALFETLHKKNNVRTLYHLTSPYICGLIQKSGFKAGSNGWCGGAIYFAANPNSVWTKAVGVNSHTGCLLRVRVDVGKVKNMPPTCDLHMTRAKLNATGHDSIKFNPGDGVEYVIFQPERVLSVTRVWKDHKLSSDDNGLAPARVDASGKPIPQNNLVEEEEEAALAEPQATAADDGDDLASDSPAVP